MIGSWSDDLILNGRGIGSGIFVHQFGNPRDSLLDSLSSTGSLDLCLINIQPSLATISHGQSSTDGQSQLASLGISR